MPRDPTPRSCACPPKLSAVHQRHDTLHCETNTAALRAKMLDFRGSVLNITLMLRGGILMSIGNSPDLSSQFVLARIIFTTTTTTTTPAAATTTNNNNNNNNNSREIGRKPAGRAPRPHASARHRRSRAGAWTSLALVL